jgi:membrane-associated phospholipid phosphatase
MLSIEKQLMSLLDYVGFFGPLIMIILVIFGLWGRTKYLIFYFIFYIVNNILNKYLKTYIKEPRPVGYDITVAPTSKYEILNGAHNYGMPSAHAQSAFYSLIFLFLSRTQFTVYSVSAIFVGAITVFQRFKNKRHSVNQLAAGGLIGSIVAYVAHTVASHMVIGGCA